MSIGLTMFWVFLLLLLMARLMKQGNNISLSSYDSLAIWIQAQLISPHNNLVCAGSLMMIVSGTINVTVYLLWILVLQLSKLNLSCQVTHTRNPHSWRKLIIFWTRIWFACQWSYLSCQRKQCIIWTDLPSCCPSYKFSSAWMRHSTSYIRCWLLSVCTWQIICGTVFWPKGAKN